MAGKGGGYDDSIINETGKYNNSKLYSERLVMSLLDYCSKLREVCYHGTGDIVEEFVITPEDKSRARFLALGRYITTMLSILTNTMGQANKPNNVTSLEIINLKLKINYSLLSSVNIHRSQQNYQGGYEWTEINEGSFNLILNELNGLFVEMTRILTQENMIHFNIPEFDEDKAKEIFTKNFVEEG